MANWEPYLQQHESERIGRLVEIGRIASVSALPAHAPDIARAAEWVAQELRGAGAENVRAIRTRGHPIVYADYLRAPGARTVLIYGHYDVAPADPEAEWTTPPFEPSIRHGRIYARGMSGSKANMLAAIDGFEALRRTYGNVPVNVKFVIEGSEEIGSGDAIALASREPALLACDLILIAGGAQFSETQPALLMGLRGACGLELHVSGPKTDQHSGLVGGAIRNPLGALAELLASLHTPDGRVAVDGFYDDVIELTPEERTRIAEVPFDEAELRTRIGVDALFGEPGYSTRERTWIRPTLDINGVWGGFQGEGNKTVIASQGHAKITCRLVPNQDPHRILDRVRSHLMRHAPAGVRVDVRPMDLFIGPYSVPPHHYGTEAAATVLRRLYGREPYHVRNGGGLPIAEAFRKALNAYAIGFGFSLEDEGLHAPNEFFRLGNFSRAQAAYCMMLEQLGR